MRLWTDAQGVQHQININWGVVQRIPAFVGCSLDEMYEKMQTPGLDSVIMLSNLLKCVLAPSATDDEFTAMTDRGKFEELSVVVGEEMRDFFHRQAGTPQDHGVMPPNQPIQSNPSMYSSTRPPEPLGLVTPDHLRYGNSGG